MYQFGDVLSIPHGIYRHYMIVVGQDWVVHGSKEKKVVVDESLGDACTGKQIANHGRWSQLSDVEIFGRARNELGKPYRVLDWNCEHVVRRISGKKEASPQVAMAVTAFVVGLGIFWLVRKRVV